MTSLHPYRSLSRREINLAHSFPSRSIRYQQHGLRKHRPPGGGDDEDDEIGDDLSTHSARKLYEKNEQNGNGRRNGNGGGGWWKLAIRGRLLVQVAVLNCQSMFQVCHGVDIVCSTK